MIICLRSDLLYFSVLCSGNIIEHRTRVIEHRTRRTTGYFASRWNLIDCLNYIPTVLITGDVTKSWNMSLFSCAKYSLHENITKTHNILRHHN